MRLVTLAIALVFCTGNARGDGDAALEKATARACAKAQAFLRSTQREDGAWECHGVEVGFSTATVLHALIASGLPGGDTSVAAGLRWFDDRPWTCGPGWSGSTETAARLVQSLCIVDPQRYRARIVELCDHLVRAQTPDGCWTGDLAVEPDARAVEWQTWRAAVALSVASVKVAYPIPSEVWGSLKDYCRRTRSKDGGWGQPRSDFGCTALGLGTYLLCGADAEAVRGGGELLRSWWIKDQRFWTRTRAVVPADAEPAEFLMSMGAVPSEEFFDAGARHILDGRQSNGGWGTPGEQGQLFATCAALLFLARATEKLEPGGRAPRTVTLTPGTTFHPPQRAEDLDEAFDAYVRLTPERQRVAMWRFGEVGSAVLGFLVGRLRDEDESRRAAAFQLLGVLLDRPLEFDARATAAVREAQIRALEADRDGAWLGARWDVRSRRFVFR